MAKVQHKPIRPARQSIPLEGIYLQLWQEFLASPWGWASVFHASVDMRQRAASVAASWMTYMGCNAGQAFTADAAARASVESISSLEDAYLAEWSWHNSRKYGTSNNLRAIEAILAPDCEAALWNQYAPDRPRPVVTMDDIDVIEQMVKWWASPVAEIVRTRAKALAEALRAGERLKQMKPENVYPDTRTIT